MQVRRSEAITFLLGALALGIGVGAVSDNLLHKGNLPRDVREFNSQYHFINPLLACGEDLNSLTGDEAKQLQREMETSIRQRRDAGDVTEVSVYYRDLTGGPWVGIDFDKTFAPKSLLKVPLAMSVYKRAEQDRALLGKKLAYTGTETSNSQFHMNRALRTFKAVFPSETEIKGRAVASGNARPKVWDHLFETVKSFFYSLWAF
jgi:hypothetical protein